MARIKPKCIIVTFKTVYPADIADPQYELDRLREQGAAEIVDLEASDEEFEALAEEIRAERVE